MRLSFMTPVFFVKWASVHFYIACCVHKKAASCQWPGLLQSKLGGLVMTGTNLKQYQNQMVKNGREQYNS